MKKTWTLALNPTAKRVLPCGEENLTFVRYQSPYILGYTKMTSSDNFESLKMSIFHYAKIHTFVMFM
jgi:hypothetical protein